RPWACATWSAPSAAARAAATVAALLGRGRAARHLGGLPALELGGRLARDGDWRDDSGDLRHVLGVSLLGLVGHGVLLHVTGSSVPRHTHSVPLLTAMRSSRLMICTVTPGLADAGGSAPST